ncbi:MAG: hypothetical protein PWP23_400, partial [Candidatus Sumerlaeota bacterium]|nr:hypothetical protein [Candidatus Sumerlaeota bacterium]
KRILELGCGLGQFLECCRHHGIEAVGVEYSEKAMQRLRQEGFEVYQHDLAEPLTMFPDESFDAVFSFQVIEHLERKAQVMSLRESYRVLRTGGQMQVDSPCRFYKEAQDAPTHIGLLSPKQLRDMAQEAGFSRINMGYNLRQKFDDIPDEIVEEIWKKYQPDIFAQTATILAYKD